MPELSVLIPVYNEEATLGRLLDAVDERPEVSEIVVVDDGSTDATAAILGAREFRHPVQLIRHDRNRGKGAAVRTALAAASGEYAVIQDADLEYDPAELASLLAPIERGRASIVYGSRSFAAHSAYSFWFVMGNKLVTLWTNVLFNSYLSDMETCYKLMPVSVWRSLDLSANGFDIEPEITAKLLRAGHRIYEVPISYAARGRVEGKKLTWRDGIAALWTLSRVRASRNGGKRERDTQPARPPGR